MSPLFMPINSLPSGVVSPLTYFVDVLNMGLGEASGFGQFGLLIDFTFLALFGLGFLFLAFALHKKTLEKRFQG